MGWNKVEADSGGKNGGICNTLNNNDIFKRRYTTCIIEYLAIKNEVFLFVTIWMNLEIIVLSEISQMKEDKKCIISLLCRI